MKPREDRFKVLIRAQLRTDGLFSEACIRDVSSRGMLLQAPAAPARGTYVEVTAQGQTMVGRVIWSRDRRFGVGLRDRINVRLFAAEARGASAPIPAGPSKRAAANADRSRGHARSFDFTALALLALVLVSVAATTVFDTLAGPLQRISRHLTPDP